MELADGWAALQHDLRLETPEVREDEEVRLVAGRERAEVDRPCQVAPLNDAITSASSGASLRDRGSIPLASLTASV